MSIYDNGIIKKVILRSQFATLESGFVQTDNVMTLYKNKYRIESTRLKNWDYSSNGYYYITICVKNRECLFGEIINKEMELNEYGKIVEFCWHDLINHYKNIQLDQFVVMPNHIHGIMVIDNDMSVGLDIIDGIDITVETGFKPVSTTNPVSTNNKHHGLFEFVRALKTFSARRINELRKTPGIPVWQTRFYDRIVRDENELINVRKYIGNNPAKWETDEWNTRGLV